MNRPAVHRFLTAPADELGLDVVVRDNLMHGALPRVRAVPRSPRR